MQGNILRAFIQAYMHSYSSITYGIIDDSFIAAVRAVAAYLYCAAYRLIGICLLGDW